MILGSPQVGKSALALRYLTKNQCDNEKPMSKYIHIITVLCTKDCEIWMTYDG